MTYFSLIALTKVKEAGLLFSNKSVVVILHRYQ
jgi:hypothetical protein